MVSFDVAPWGEIGNVKVVASEPTEEFGTHAVQVIRTAKFDTAPSGVSDCIERVVFKPGPHGTKPLEGAEPNQSIDAVSLARSRIRYLSD